MTILNQLEQMEKAATPWSVGTYTFYCHSKEELAFVQLLRNHAADLIAVARAAQRVLERDDWPEPDFDDTLEEIEAALTPLLTDEGETA